MSARGMLENPAMYAGYTLTPLQVYWRIQQSTLDIHQLHYRYTGESSNVRWIYINSITGILKNPAMYAGSMDIHELQYRYTGESSNVRWISEYTSPPLQANKNHDDLKKNCFNTDDDVECSQ